MNRTGRKKLDEFLQRLDTAKHSGYLELKLGREDSKALFEDFLWLFSTIDQLKNTTIELQNRIIELQEEILRLERDRVIQIEIDQGKGF